MAVEFPGQNPSVGEWEHKGSTYSHASDKVGFEGIAGIGDQMHQYKAAAGGPLIGDDLLSNMGWSVEQGPQGYNWYNLGDDLGYVAAHGERRTDVDPGFLPPDDLFNNISFSTPGGWAGNIGGAANWGPEEDPDKTYKQRFQSVNMDHEFDPFVGYNWSALADPSNPEYDLDRFYGDVSGFQSGPQKGEKSWNGAKTNIFEATKGSYNYHPDVAFTGEGLPSGFKDRSWTDDPTGNWWYRGSLGDDTGGDDDTGEDVSRGEGISLLADSISGGEDSNIGTELYDPLIEAQALYDAMGGEGSGGGEGSLETNAAGELTQESIDELLADMPKDVRYRGGVGISPIRRGGYDSEKRDAMEGELNTPSLQDFIRNMSGFGNIENGMSAYLGDSTEGEIDYSTLDGNWQGSLKSSPGYSDYILQMLAGASDEGFGTLPIMDPPSVPTPPVPPTTY